MLIEEACQVLQQKLTTIYEESESANIAGWVMESLTGLRRREWLSGQRTELDAAREEKWRQYTTELMDHRPVQYVLGESYFYDLKLFVDERVLIPRPETEELADWALKHTRVQGLRAPLILDIGTGSGCLALTLKKHIPEAGVYGADISTEALAVAARNATTLDLDVHWLELDILNLPDPERIPELDILISNPPYITLPEQETMMPHVLQFEPHKALFVTNNDPLQFYKAIETLATQRLKPGGAIFLELHRDFAVPTQQYYRAQGWTTILKKDMQGNDRMLLCYR